MSHGWHMIVVQASAVCSATHTLRETRRQPISRPRSRKRPSWSPWPHFNRLASRSSTSSATVKLLYLNGLGPAARIVPPTRFRAGSPRISATWAGSIFGGSMSHQSERDQRQALASHGQATKLSVRSTPCYSQLLMGAKRVRGRDTASQMAAASVASSLPPTERPHLMARAGWDLHGPERLQIIAPPIARECAIEMLLR